MAAKTSALRWLVPVALAVLVVAVGAGLLVREFYRLPAPQSSSPTDATPSSTAQATDQAGSGSVQGAQDAVAHPQYQAVKSLLQKHFDAINARDYDGWKNTVTSRRVQETPEGRWLDDYTSTKDGGMVIYRLEAAPANQLRVLLFFRSVQDPKYAPNFFREPCILWNVVYPLSREDGAWKIDTGPSTLSTQVQNVRKC